jgi:hypothetical protein
MALDVEKITGSTALVAARLCNFPTAHANLMPTHIAWLDNEVAQKIRSLPEPWVDLIGYASHLGNASFNKKLSFDRCESIRKRIEGYGHKVSFPVEWAKGEESSGGGASDNSGYWRAVEVYVYGVKPPPKPVPPVIKYKHKVRLHFRSVAMPKVPEFTALANAQRVYDKYAILLEFASGFSMGANSEDLIQLDASDGTCNWNQASDEQQLLNKLGGRNGVGPNEVVVYFANRIVENDGKKLNGCAGHLPGKPTVVVASGGSPWTLGHELCHVLLGPNFDPVHSTDSTNLMFTPTASITANPPSLTPAQVTAVRASKFCLPI